jgi:hypothetical protein
VKQHDTIKIFEDKKVRTLGMSMKRSGISLCHDLKMKAVDGKMRLTDVADIITKC